MREGHSFNSETILCDAAMNQFGPQIPHLRMAGPAFHHLVIEFAILILPKKCCPNCGESIVLEQLQPLFKRVIDVNLPSAANDRKSTGTINVSNEYVYTRLPTIHLVAAESHLELPICPCLYSPCIPSKPSQLLS